MNRLGTFSRLLLALPTALLYSVFFLIPIGVLLRYSFASSKNLRVDLIWTLDNYRVFFEGAIYGPLLIRSLGIAALVTAITILIGFPAAWLIAQAPERRRNLLLVLMILPWWASFIVRIFAWYTIFGNNGIINRTLILLGLTTEPLEFFAFNLPAVIVTEVNLYLPLVIIPIYMTLERIDRNLVLGARSLGASRWYVLRRIILPLTMPGIIAAMIFVFMPVAGTFIVPELVGGASGIMIGKVIASQFGSASNWALGSALSAILLLTLLLALAMLTTLRRRFSGEFH
jgi:spermidine/putrescine transport system permease protein